MSDTDKERDFKVLELGPKATLAEVKTAYLRLKRLYSAESALLSPISQEIAEDKRLRILLEVEEAYLRLLQYFREEASLKAERGGPAQAAPLRPPSVSGASPEKGVAAGEELAFSGPVLKRIRESLGIPLQLIFHTTKIRVEQLEAIEEENFAKLPDEAYLKVHLKEYAGHLSLNPKRVINDYLKRYTEWKRINRPDQP